MTNAAMGVAAQPVSSGRGMAEMLLRPAGCREPRRAECAASSPSALPGFPKAYAQHLPSMPVPDSTHQGARNQRAQQQGQPDLSPQQRQAAVAATLREDALDHYWKEPIAKRDWDVDLVTRFIDALVVAGPGRGA